MDGQSHERVHDRYGHGHGKWEEDLDRTEEGMIGSFWTCLNP